MPYVSDFNGGRLFEFTEDHLFNLVSGLFVLVLGLALIFLTIYILRTLVFRKINVNRYFAKFTGRPEPIFDLEKTILRLFFFAALIFVFSLAANISQLDVAVDFFDSILEWLTGVLSLIFRALIPIAAALIFSYLARAGILWFGKTVNLDEKLGKRLDAGEALHFKLTKTLSEVAYGVVFLYFLPQILNGVGLDKLSGPITKMFEEITAFFPKLVAAALILFLGWFIARILKQIVEGLLFSVGIDGLIKKVFGDNLLGNLKLSKIVPGVLYILVILLVAAQALDKLELNTLTAPVQKLLNSLAEILLPATLAILVVFTAIYFGGIIANFVAGVFKEMGFDNIYSKLGLKEIKTGSRSPSQIVGFLASVTVIVLVTMQALNSLGLQDLSHILQNLIVMFGNIMLGVIVFGVGLYVANLVSTWISQGVSLSYHNFLALVAKVVIIVISGAMALQQMGIADEIVTIAFALSMGSVALGVAIAIGLGSKDIAGELARDFIKKLKD